MIIINYHDNHCQIILTIIITAIITMIIIKNLSQCKTSTTAHIALYARAAWPDNHHDYMMKMPTMKMPMMKMPMKMPMMKMAMMIITKMPMMMIKMMLSMNLGK